MRYYDITITDPLNPSGPVQVYTSWVNGQNDPGALNVLLDIYTVPFATPRGASAIEIWGIPIQTISQATNLRGHFGINAERLPRGVGWPGQM